MDPRSDSFQDWNVLPIDHASCGLNRRFRVLQTLR